MVVIPNAPSTPRDACKIHKEGKPPCRTLDPPISGRSGLCQGCKPGSGLTVQLGCLEATAHLVLHFPSPEGHGASELLFQAQGELVELEQSGEAGPEEGGLQGASSPEGEVIVSSRMGSTGPWEP